MKLKISSNMDVLNQFSALMRTDKVTLMVQIQIDKTVNNFPDYLVYDKI